jgi:putative flippase GtrA
MEHRNGLLKTNMASKKNKLKFLEQFIKFNIIGILNTGITYMIFSGIFYLTNSKAAALAGDYSFGILFSFFANRHFTFKSYGQNMISQFIKMLSTYVLIFFINLGILFLLNDRLSINTYISQIVALMIIMLLSFLNQRLFVFRKKRVP